MCYYNEVDNRYFSSFNNIISKLLKNLKFGLNYELHEQGLKFL